MSILRVRINEIDYEMLIDSGAEINAISEKYKNLIISNNERIPVLPINGMNIYNTVGKKSTKVSTLMIVPIKLKSIITHVPLIFIEKLNEDGILENAFLKKHNATIDFENRILIIHHEKGKTIILFTNCRTQTSIEHIKLIKTQPISEHPQNKLNKEQQQYVYPIRCNTIPGYIPG